MRYERITKLQNRFAEGIHNIYANASRFRWEFSFVQEAIRTNIYENEDYRRLPRYAQTFLAGVLHQCRRLHDRLMVYSYEIDGVRMMITEERYRKVSPERVHREFSHTGAYVYRDDPTKIWYSGRNAV